MVILIMKTKVKKQHKRKKYAQLIQKLSLHNVFIAINQPVNEPGKQFSMMASDFQYNLLSLLKTFLFF